VRNYSAIEKARDRLGYRPSVGLEEGIRQTHAWFAGAPTEVTS